MKCRAGVIVAIAIAFWGHRAAAQGGGINELELDYEIYLQDQKAARPTPSSFEQELPQLNSFAQKFHQANDFVNEARVRGRSATLLLRIGRPQLVEREVTAARASLPPVYKLLHAQLLLISSKAYQLQSRFGDTLRAFQLAREAAAPDPAASSKPSPGLGYAQAVVDLAHGVPGAEQRVQREQRGLTELYQNFGNQLTAMHAEQARVAQRYASRYADLQRQSMSTDPQQRESAQRAYRELQDEVQREQRRAGLRYAFASRPAQPARVVGYDATLNELVAPLGCQPLADFDPKRSSMRSVVDGFFVTPAEAQMRAYSEPEIIKVWLGATTAPALPEPMANAFGTCLEQLTTEISRAYVWRSRSAPDSLEYAGALSPILEAIAGGGGPAAGQARDMLATVFVVRGLAEARAGQAARAKVDLERALPSLYAKVASADTNRLAVLYELARLAPRENRPVVLKYLSQERQAAAQLAQQGRAAVAAMSGNSTWAQLGKLGISHGAALANDPTNTRVVDTIMSQSARALSPFLIAVELVPRVVLPLGTARVLDMLGERQDADQVRSKLEQELAADPQLDRYEYQVFKAVLHADLGERAEREGNAAAAAKEDELSARYFAEVLQRRLLTFDVAYESSRSPAEVFEQAIRWSLEAGQPGTAFELSQLAKALVDPLRAAPSARGEDQHSLEARLLALEKRALAGEQGAAAAKLEREIASARAAATQPTALVSPLATADVRLEPLVGHIPREELAEMKARLNAFEEQYQSGQSALLSGEKQAVAASAASRADAAYHASGDTDLPAFRARATHQDELLRLRNASAISSPLTFRKLPSSANVQAALDPTESLLAFFWGKERLTAFVVTRGSITGIMLPEGTQQRVRAAVPQSHSGKLAALRTLYDLVLAPLRSKWVGSDLSIMPDGLLYDVPFEALYDGKQHIFSVFRSHRLSYARDRGSPSSTPAPVREIAAVTAPAAEGLPQLSAAETEIDNVKKAFPGSLVRAVPHVSETELRRLMAEAGVVHVAAHAELIPENPKFARLRLGADARNDGALEANEIAGLTLPHLELVVLGACGSASQAPAALAHSAHASSTLASAFLAAGAKSVVATLWPIDDASTAELMLHFYAALAQHKSKPEALDLAREKVRSDHNLGPLGSWASFVLIGDPSPISVAQASPG